jgi:hypothetical protein
MAGSTSSSRSHRPHRRHAESSRFPLTDRAHHAPHVHRVLEGAADFFIIRDRYLAQDLLERARALEPNSARWPRKLAQLHRLNATQGDPSEARLALAEMERAYAMTPANDRALPTELAVPNFGANLRY